MTLLIQLLQWYTASSLDALLFLWTTSGVETPKNPTQKELRRFRDRWHFRSAAARACPSPLISNAWKGEKRSEDHLGRAKPRLVVGAMRQENKRGLRGGFPLVAGEGWALNQHPALFPPSTSGDKSGKWEEDNPGKSQRTFSCGQIAERGLSSHGAKK